jgi:glutathione synthase/RimK-type ligase-like ATP-grasp enzyme
VNSIKSLTENNFKTTSLLRTINGTSPDCILKCDNKQSLINYASKLLWEKEYSISQTFLQEQNTTSYCLLVINGECKVLTEFHDKSRNDGSNNTTSQNTKLKQ